MSAPTLHHYESIAAVRARADAPATNKRNDTMRQGNASGRGPAWWYGYPGEDDVRARLDADIAAGFPEGRKRAEELSHDIRLPQLKSRKRRRVRSDNGDTVDRDMVNAGRLDVAWTRTVRRATSAPPALAVCIDPGIRANQAAGELIWRGLAAWLLATHLQRTGYNIRVVVAERSRPAYMRGGGPEEITAMTVKHPRRRIDEGAILAAVALPGVSRCYRYAARYAHNTRALKDGLGRPLGMRGQDWPRVCDANERPLVIPKTVHDRASAQQSLDNIIRELNR